MKDEMDEYKPFDEYADQFTITFNTFGANLSFATFNPDASINGQTAESRHLGTIRMSAEDVKTMVMVMWRQILRIERNTGVSIKVPPQVLDQFQISPEDWDTFWKLK